MTRGVDGPGSARAALAEHYDRWPFPGVEHASREGLVLLRRLTAWVREAATAGRVPRVLDAGCGTGHTVVALARHLSETEFVGVDVAELALEAARAHAAEAGAANVRFVPGDVAGALPALGTFDVVLSLGVLHHVPDREAAFARLAALLPAGGRLVLWLYGRHGRLRHTLHQRFLRLLADAAPGADTVALARTFLAELGARFAAGSGFYTPLGSGEEGIAWLLEHPAWLADQMVPAFERPVLLAEILALFDAHGIAFEHWFGVSEDLARYTSHPELLGRFGLLSGRERLLALECLLAPSYYFVAGRKAPAGP